MKIGLAAALALAMGSLTVTLSASPRDGAESQGQQALVAWETAYHRALIDHRQALAQRGDSRSLLAAAELHVGMPMGVSPVDEAQRERDKAMADAWLARAVITEPVDTLALWRAASGCAVGDNGCDRTARWQRLAEHDPDNAMVWLTLAADALRRDDLALAERHFTHASSLPRFDAYDVDYGRLLIEAHEGFEPPGLAPEWVSAVALHLTNGQSDAMPFDLTDVLLMARWSAHAVPSLGDVTRFCPSDTASLSTTRLDECRRLLATISQSATMLVVEQFALSVIARITQGERDGATWLEALRQASWREQKIRDLMTESHGGEPVPGYIRQVLGQGELAAMANVLKAAGLVGEAPKDWLPERGAARDLLVGSEG